MSILVIEIVPDGMIFAADKNITQTKHSQESIVQTQYSGTKILQWPDGRGLIGYVGQASISGQSMSEWLLDFIKKNERFINSKLVAEDLKGQIEKEFNKYEIPQSVIVEFGVFEEDEGNIIPKMWHITNVPGLDDSGYFPAVREFSCTEEIVGNHLRGIPKNKIREQLSNSARNGQPFWFHQGFDLAKFNLIELKMKEALNYLIIANKLSKPESLSEWEKFAKMWVLVYGSFFEAFAAEGEKYVGGGADVISIPWPKLK